MGEKKYIIIPYTIRRYFYSVRMWKIIRRVVHFVGYSKIIAYIDIMLTGLGHLNRTSYVH